ncbi:MAG: pyridoxal phosphate-dependent aminotransferase [Acidobacteria bacterium]|nr:pyridoxal phosphate-dependent aminotransferase [Acidobacteriota bacterium]
MFSSRTNWNRTPNRLSEALARRRAAGLEILDLTESNPTRCGFAWDADALFDALRRLEIADYRPEPRGLEEARSAVRGYYADQGIAIEDEQIVLTASTSEAYAFVLRLLTEPGDEVLGPAPSYPLIQYLADLHDVTLSHYPLLYDHGWTVDAATLESSVTDRTRAVIAVSPNNPTGSYLGDRECKRIRRLAAEHGIALVVDEVFRDYSWSESARPPASTVTVEECLTFTLSGLSKVSALPQMKLGWIVVSGPAALRDEALGRLEVIADTYLSVSTPVQVAARSLIEMRAKVQEGILRRVRGNLAELDDILSGSRCSRLQGEAGWYAVLRVPNTRGDEEWALDLIEKEGVYLLPGHFFDFPGEGHLVISLISPPEAIHSGCKRLVRNAN